MNRIHTKSRNRLSTERADKLVFLHMNLRARERLAERHRNRRKVQEEATETGSTVEELLEIEDNKIKRQEEEELRLEELAEEDEEMELALQQIDQRLSSQQHQHASTPPTTAVSESLIDLEATMGHLQIVNEQTVAEEENEIGSTQQVGTADPRQSTTPRKRGKRGKKIDRNG